jgi:hypothetical protein
MASASSGWGPISRKYSKNALASKGSQPGTVFLPWGVLDAIEFSSTFSNITLSESRANDDGLGDGSGQGRMDEFINSCAERFES